jgi:hypothetical protein
MCKRLERTGLAGESMMFRCPLSMSFLNSSIWFCNVMMVLVSSSDMLFDVEAILCVHWLVTLNFLQFLKDAQESVDVDKSSIFLVAKSRYQSELRRLWLIPSPCHALSRHTFCHTRHSSLSKRTISCSSIVSSII